MLTWTCLEFPQLHVEQLYRVLRLRVAVFVVEQNCVFQDLDNRDPLAWHLLGCTGSGTAAEVFAYARLLPPGILYAEPSIGRVVTDPQTRGRGHGEELLNRCIARCEALWPGHGIRISAQQYLERFYQAAGFETIRGPYLEDGIPHMEMLRPATAT